MSLILLIFSEIIVKLKCMMVGNFFGINIGCIYLELNLIGENEF